MSDEGHPENEPGPEQGGSSPSEGAHSQEVQHSQVSAIVPEHVARGIFSTGAVVLQGPHEFILDFLLRMASPQQVASRIVLPPGVVARFIAALRENIQKYEARFGPIQQPKPLVPNPPEANPVQPSAQELYEQLKLKDDVLSGTYANAVMIGHTATEFSFDFITTFFPRSAVAQRLFLSAPNAPRLLESLVHSYSQFERRVAQNPPPPLSPPEGDQGKPPEPGDDDVPF